MVSFFLVLGGFILSCRAFLSTLVLSQALKRDLITKKWYINKSDDELVDSGAEGSIKKKTNALSRFFFMGDYDPSHSGSNYD